MKSGVKAKSGVGKLLLHVLSAFEKGTALKKNPQPL